MSILLFMRAAMLGDNVCPKRWQLGCFHCKNMCKLTSKEVAAEILFTVCLFV